MSEGGEGEGMPEMGCLREWGEQEAEIGRGGDRLLGAESLRGDPGWGDWGSEVRARALD